MIRLAALLCFFFIALPATASTSESHDSYLTLTVERATVAGEWKIRLLDLQSALRLDANHDGEATWSEIEHRRADIESYLGSHLQVLTHASDPGITFGQLIYGAQNGEPFILSRFAMQAPEDIEKITVDYSPLNQRSLDDRCVLKVIWSGKGMHQAMLSTTRRTLSFDRSAASSSEFAEFLQSGIWHIGSGYDHVLFLIVLLIPAVYRRTEQGREAVSDMGSVLGQVLIIVSAFTVAHSITLTCAVMQWIHLPVRLVESAIAASIFLAAVHNFLPSTAGGRGAWLAFGFGLLHGFGFAGVLSDVDTAGAPLWRVLLAFNLGVEVGQLAIVAAFLPMAFFLRETRFYRTGVLYGGSSIASVCALFWFWRRAFV
jgi:hypothetical protein